MKFIAYFKNLWIALTTIPKEKSEDNSLEASFITNFSIDLRPTYEEFIRKNPDWKCYIEEIAYGEGGWIVKNCHALHSPRYTTEPNRTQIWNALMEYVSTHAKPKVVTHPEDLNIK
jgi:hypothetical protein